MTLPFKDSARVSWQRLLEHIIGALVVVGLLVAMQQPGRDNARIEREVRQHNQQVRSELRDLREDFRRLVIRIDTDFYRPRHQPQDDRRNPPTPDVGYVDGVFDRRRLEMTHG